MNVFKYICMRFILLLLLLLLFITVLNCALHLYKQTPNLFLIRIIGLYGNFYVWFEVFISVLTSCDALLVDKQLLTFETSVPPPSSFSD